MVLICLLALGAGCATTPPAGSPRWTAPLDPHRLGRSRSDPRSATITAEFSEGRVAGSAGVNQYNASVTSSTDGSFAVDPPISTKMAGPEDAMAAESTYLRRLEAATSYRVDGDTLVVNDADGQPSLTFTRA